MSVEVLTTDHPKARKSHICFACSGTIEPGETYERSANVFDGRIYTVKMCHPCTVLRNEVWEWAYHEDGISEEDYREWATEHVIHGTPEQQKLAKDYLERGGVS